MIFISVKDAVNTLRKAQNELSEKQLNTAISRSINETILQGRTVARSAVKSMYNIPQRYLSGINVNKSTSVSLYSELFASSKPIPMDAFAPKFETSSQALSITKRGIQKQRSFKNAKSNPVGGVSIEVIKGQREIIPFAFLIPGAKARVFARGQYKEGTAYGFVQRHQRMSSTGNDIPVKPLISITVHAAVINKDSLERIETKVNSVFPISIQRNIKFLLEKVGP